MFTIVLISVLICLNTDAQILKIATLAPEGSGWVRALREIDRDVRKQTNKEVRLKIYPGGVQGDEDVMIRKIRVGQLQGGGFGGTGVSDIFPDVLALEMPFLFNNYEEIEYVLRETYEFYKNGYEKNGYVLLGWSDVGFVHLFSQKPIAGIDDIRGRKVWRLKGEPITEVLFRKVGVTSVPLTIPDVLMGLQTDLVEVVYTSPSAAIVLQWFTRVSHYTMLPINYVLGALLVKRTAFEQLSTENKKILINVSEHHMSAQRLKSRSDNEEALEIISEHGVSPVELPEPEISAFKQLVAESLPDLKGQAFSDESYDRIQTHLHNFRRTVQSKSVSE